MLSMLIAYNAAGEVISTLDYMVARDENGDVIGLIDFVAHEDRGSELTDVWVVEGAAGSKTWPEWIGAQAHGFRVELEGPAGGKHIAALVHQTSGVRRERSAVEGAIQERIEQANGKPADIRDLVGGPDRPILLDEDGRTKNRIKNVPPILPAFTLT